MKQMILAISAAAVLATSAGKTIAAVDGNTAVLHQVLLERVDARACGGGECGLRARPLGEALQRQWRARASGIDWRNPYRQQKAQIVEIDWRNPYRQRAARR